MRTAVATLIGLLLGTCIGCASATHGTVRPRPYLTDQDRRAVDENAVDKVGREEGGRGARPALDQQVVDVMKAKDILRKMDALLAKAEFTRADVRELLVYVTDEEAGRAVEPICRAGFGERVAITRTLVKLAAAGALVEIMSYAERG